MDVVKTNTGYVSGTVLTGTDKTVRIYRGIPFAAPPIGDLRWKPPQPVIPWKGTRECTAFSLIAPQSGAADAGGMYQSEDCLYLNVLTPAHRASEKLPVMVWFHGGGFTSGSGNNPMFHGSGLPLHGVVLVNVNMRLGPLGCMAHPLLSAESPNGISGNYLFLDLVAALKWVKENIAGFGGDPNNVTIFGVSGGSAKVINMMASPLAKGLFHRAIGQSGSSPSSPLRTAEEIGEKVFAKLGVDKEKDPLAAARALPWKKIIEAGMAVGTELKRPMGPWDSAVDGWFLPDTIANIFKAGKQNAVPFIMGANLGELTGPGFIVMPPRMITDYVNLFAGANKAGEKAYAYLFDHVPAQWKKEDVVSVHTIETPYVFGDMDGKSERWALLYNWAKPCGVKSADPGLTDVDKELSEKMMQIWANFAKTGNPNLKGVVEWPAYDEASDQYLSITEKFEVKSGFSRVAQK